MPLRVGGGGIAVRCLRHHTGNLESPSRTSNNSSSNFSKSSSSFALRVAPVLPLSSQVHAHESKVTGLLFRLCLRRARTYATNFYSIATWEIRSVIFSHREMQVAAHDAHCAAMTSPPGPRRFLHHHEFCSVNDKAWGLSQDAQLFSASMRFIFLLETA